MSIRGSGNGLEGWADLTIALPPGQRFSLYLGVGGTTVDNVDGDIEVDARSGSVATVETTGRLRVDTGSGLVQVMRGAHLRGRIGDGRGRIAIDTGSGSVRVLGD